MICLKDFDSAQKYFFFFKDKEILVTQDNTLPDFNNYNELSPYITNTFVDSTFSALGGEFVTTEEKSIPEEILSSLNLHFVTIRQFFADSAFCSSSENIAALAARMKSLLEWTKNTKFCCTCGKPLVSHQKENALYCPACKKTHFPRIEPCIILLIHKGDEVLLLRHSYRNQDIFACLAGFIEVGESVEEAVHREVMEEVGLKIKNLQYKGSQGWPFPDQLMLAFTAEYDSGEITPQEEEIAEARWFKPEEIKGDSMARPGSVAYRLLHNLF